MVLELVTELCASKDASFDLTFVREENENIFYNGMKTSL